MALFSRVKEWFFPSIRDRELLLPGRAYTKDDINLWLMMARQGDTRYLSSFKAEMRASDPDLDSHILKLEAMLSQAPFDVQPWPMPPGWKKTKTPEEQLALDVATYCREQIMDPDIDRMEVVSHALWGILEGVTGFQVMVKPGVKEKLVSLDPIPSERFWWAPNSPTLQVFPTENPFNPVNVADLGDSIAVSVKDPHLITRERVGVLRRCFAAWLTRRNGLEWWGTTLQRHGQPWPKAKYKGSLTEKQLEKIEKLIQNVGPNGYGLFPDAIDVEFVQALVSSGLGSVHREAIEYCERAYAKALLGGTQTADIQKGAGSIASAKIHSDMLDAMVAYYAALIAAFIRQQILKPLVRRNFGPEVAERNTPLATLQAGKRAELLTFFQAMNQAKTLGFGPSIPRAWVHMQTSIPVPEEGEPVLDAPALPPGPDANALPPVTDTAESERVISGQEVKVSEAAVLNGAQIQAAFDIVSAVAGKQIPRDSGIGQLMIMFNLTSDQANQVMGSAGAGFDGAPVPPQAVPADIAASARLAVDPKVLDNLEEWATGFSSGAGDEILAPYEALIREVKRDGGDLGHLAARVRLQAQMAGEPPAKTADLIGAVMAQAILTGFAQR